MDYDAARIVMRLDRAGRGQRLRGVGERHCGTREHLEHQEPRGDRSSRSVTRAQSRHYAFHVLELDARNLLAGAARRA
jgi:hypothetical protein